MGRLGFEITAADGRARRGVLSTRRGRVDTPAFMPVGTQGTVKGLLPGEVAALGGQMVLANTYHLLLRPGVEVVQSMGGLHRFMDWPGPILTDSGGYQVFSLAALRQVSEQGVAFRSHLDGAAMHLSPEGAVRAQEAMGSDIMMMLDECPPPGAGHAYLERALLRDARWAARALEARRDPDAALMGIVQGGVHPALRRKSVELLADLEMEGYALGGLSVGEPKEEMMAVIEQTAKLMPLDKPIYLMGVGKPEDLVASVGLGVDLFDCVLPTRMARNGGLLTPEGTLSIRNARYKDDPQPVDQDCACPLCSRFSRAYLRHLFMAKELLAYRLASLHNLSYVLGLMSRLRQAIEQEQYQDFSRKFFRRREEAATELKQGVNDV